MIKGKNVFFLLIGVILTSHTLVADVSISLPTKTQSGDFVSIVFSSTEAINDVDYAVARLYQPNGKKAVSVKAFYADDNKKKMVALLGMSIFWNSGDWIIEGEIKAKGEISKKRATLVLHKKEFAKETVPMGKRNTSIVKNKSAKKKRQIQSFAALVNRQNLDATVHSAPMVLPVKSKRRTGGFADARVYTYSDGSSASSYHWGLDFGVPTGTRVNASGAGRVIFAENRITTGYTLAIEHAPGVVSMYFHLSKLLVRVGEKVNPGQKIALSGCTGLSTGPHLHWEVRINGRRVSPDALCEKPLF